MTTRSSTYPLRLPVSLKDALEKIAAEDGTSMNQFIVTAVAEKIAVLKTAEMFAERRARADLEAFDRLLARKGGAPPCPDDVIPDDLREAVAQLRDEPPPAA
jgi:hypothetical protein